MQHFTTSPARLENTRPGKARWGGVWLDERDFFKHRLTDVEAAIYQGLSENRANLQAVRKQSSNSGPSERSKTVRQAEVLIRWRKYVPSYCLWDCAVSAGNNSSGLKIIPRLVLPFMMT